MDLDLDSARSLLEVERGASARDVRKAYFRLLRTFRPDQDPAGFMRLRAAYELLSEARYEDDDPDPPEAPLDVQLEERSLLPEIEPGDPGADELDALEQARARTVQEPGSQVAWRKLLDVLEDREQDDERLAVYHSAIAAGHEELLDELAAEFPTALLDSEAALLRTREDPWSHLALVRRAQGSAQPVSAAAPIAGVMERAETGPGYDVALVYCLTEALLDLFSASWGKVGSPLVERLWRGLEQQQLGMEHLGSALLARLVLARELAACVDALPPELVRFVVDQIRWESAQEGVAPLWTYRATHSGECYWLPTELGVSAPNLARLIETFLEPDPPVEESRQGWLGSHWWVFLAAAVVRGVYALLPGSDGRSSSQSGADRTGGEPPPATAPASPRDDENRLLAVQAWLSRQGKNTESQAVARIWLGLQDQDCGTLESYWPVLLSKLRRRDGWPAGGEPPPVPSSDSFLIATHRLLEERCPSDQFSAPDGGMEKP